MGIVERRDGGRVTSARKGVTTHMPKEAENRFFLGPR